MMMHFNSPVIIWLDINANDPNSGFLAKLEDHQEQYVRTFTDPNACVAFIKAYPKQAIFLVVSGSFGSQVVPQIFECPNIVQIFLFCASIVAHADWAMDYCDKLLMYDHQDDLLQRLFTEMEQFMREQAKQCMKQADECKERAQKLKQQPCG